MGHAIKQGVEGAYDNGQVSERLQHHALQPDNSIWPSRPGEQQYGWEPQRVVENTRHKRQAKRQIDADRTEQSDVRQTERSMGRDIDGSSGRLDYAELCVAGDNRTDELRLLGNGVVPATAELAYRTLMRELFTA